MSENYCILYNYRVSIKQVTHPKFEKKHAIFTIHHLLHSRNLDIDVVEESVELC